MLVLDGHDDLRKTFPQAIISLISLTSMVYQDSWLNSAPKSLVIDKKKTEVFFSLLLNRIDYNDLFMRNEKGETHRAPLEALLNYLKENQSEINRLDSIGWSPLMLFAHALDFVAVVQLISLGADIQLQAERGPQTFRPTVMHTAIAALGDSEVAHIIAMIKLLIVMGGDPSLRSTYYNLVEEVDFHVRLGADQKKGERLKKWLRSLEFSHFLSQFEKLSSSGRQALAKKIGQMSYDNALGFCLQLHTDTLL